MFMSVKMPAERGGKKSISEPYPAWIARMAVEKKNPRKLVLDAIDSDASKIKLNDDVIGHIGKLVDDADFKPKVVPFAINFKNSVWDLASGTPAARSLSPMENFCLSLRGNRKAKIKKKNFFNAILSLVNVLIKQKIDSRMPYPCVCINLDRHYLSYRLNELQPSYV